MNMDVYRIRRDGQGMGGFLCPPGHPNLEYVLEGFYGRSQESKPSIAARMRGCGPDLIGSIESALDDKYIPSGIRDQARRIIDGAKTTCSPDWVAMVYGYFRNSYSPDGTEQNVSVAIHPGAAETVPPATHHLGYLTVRSHFPDHEPDLDLIAGKGTLYGTKACVYCDSPVQYEARWDRWVIYPHGRECSHSP